KKSFEVEDALFCPYCRFQLHLKKRAKLADLDELIIVSPLHRERLKRYLFGTFINNLTDQQILHAISQLTKAQRKVIIRSHGLDGKHYRTDKQIAEEVSTNLGNA